MKRSITRWLLLSLVVLTFSAASFGQVGVGISVRIGPPPLPVYAQPICPGPGYMWTPGYWAWNDDDGYYWVPGTWVVAPVGLFWTPGYWGWGDGLYLWHGGYWGPHVGFYGGINYGFGYTGVGFYGGEWRGRNFYYNRSVTNVSVTNVTNVYNRTVVVRNENHVAYNGGNGGVRMRPTPQQERWAHESHTPALSAQREHEHMAAQNRENFARENHGRPAVAATARPADFRHAVVPARAAGGEYHAPAMSPREARASSNAGNRGNSKEGSRPFTPPSKGGAAGNERGGNNASRNDRPSNDNRSNAGRTNENRAAENRSTPNRANDNRPPQNRGNENRMNENRPSQNRPPESRMNENRPNQNRPPETRMNENRPSQNRPQNQPREASRPQQNAPRENSRPAPAPNRQSAPPKDDHHRGR